MKSRALMVALAAAACVGEAPPRPVEPLPMHELCVWSLQFEPPLRSATTLTILHESGWSWSGEIRPTGGELLAPPGPANLSLQLETPLELVISIAADMPVVCWVIPKE